MQNLWWSVVPAILAALGYLAKRWLERRRQGHALKQKLQALALHQGMKRAGITMQDLEKLEQDASAR